MASKQEEWTEVDGDEVESCATCRFFSSVQLQSDEELGLCRRRSPQVGTPTEEVPAVAWRTTLGFWPACLPGEWCGEWQPKIGGAE